MTCEEFRSYASDRSTAGDRTGAAHLEICQECRKLAFVEEQLERCLQVVRERAPEVPKSLDLAVMRAYRQGSERKSVSLGRRTFATVIAWAAVAAALILGVVLLVAHRKSDLATNEQVVHSDPTPVPAPKPVENVATKPVSGPRFATAKKHAHVVQAKSGPTPPSAVGNNATSAGFQSLMYCDELSCSGAMDVVRIEIPAAAVNRAAWRPANGMVQAGVVVGSDGVARAIRIVR